MHLRLPFRASLLVRVLALRDCDGLIGQPGDSGRCLAHIVSCRRSLLVLPGDHELASRIKIDDVTGQHPDIDDIADPPGLYARARWWLLALRQEPDLLRAYRHMPAVTLDQVRDPGEPGDRTGLRPIVDVQGRADLLN